MPIDMSSNIKEAKSYVLFSKVAEIIAVINVLSDSKHHVFAKDYASDLCQRLSEKSRNFLKKVSNLPYQGIEFYEILLDSRIFDSSEKFAEKIISYDNIEFIHTLAGEELGTQEIKELKNNKNNFKKFIDDMEWVFRGNAEVFENIIYDTDTFKEDMANLIREIDGEYFNKLLLSLKTNYGKAIEDIKHKLKNETPISVGEAVMNRKIAVDSNVTEYFFLPSFYISPHYVMAYKRSARLFLYDIRGNSSDLDNSRKRLVSKLKVVSDDTRLEILRLLILQPIYGKLLADRLKLTTATISHHLEILSAENLITESRDKNTKYFSANSEEIEKLLEEFKDYLFNK